MITDFDIYNIIRNKGKSMAFTQGDCERIAKRVNSGQKVIVEIHGKKFVIFKNKTNKLFMNLRAL